ncbi:hypothetical protein ACEN8K_18960 [Variovorax sp. CT11-76]
MGTMQADTVALVARTGKLLSTAEYDEAAVEYQLTVALNALRQAQTSAAKAGYGDQFIGSIDEAVKQVEYTKGMLS